MKKYIYCALIALIAISCNNDDDPLMDDTSIVIPQDLNAQAPTFESRATFEYQLASWEVSEAVDSRTYAEPEGDGNQFYNQYWSPNDAISYFETTDNLKYESNITDKGQIRAQFTLTSSPTGEGVSLNTDGYKYSVYPYKESTTITTDGTVTFNFPKTQDYCGDTYANGANGMIAKHQDYNELLKFVNFCSYLTISLTSAENKTINQIILKANNEEELLSGTGTIKFNSNDEPIVSMIPELSTNKITLDCRGKNVTLSSTPTKFWFVLPGGVKFNNGFNITVYFTDGTFYQQATSDDKTIEIKRNHIKPMDNLPIKNTVVNGPIRYKCNDTETSAYDKNSLTESFYDEEGNKLEVIDQKLVNGEWIIILDGPLYKINRNAFQDKDYDFEYIIIEETNQNYIELEECAFYQCTAETITINHNIERIGSQICLAANVQRIEIGGSIKTIEKNAFFLNNKLNYITLENVDIIEPEAFNFCISLQTVNINTVNSIGNSAFSSCSNLKSIEIGTVNTIGEKAFTMCTTLTTATINEVVTINEYAFSNCLLLTNIDMNSIVNIGTRAFTGCYSLTSITLPNTLQTIGQGAFIDSGIKTVQCLKTTAPNGDMYMFPEGTTIYIPTGCEDNYDKLYWTSWSANEWTKDEPKYNIIANL